MKAYLLKKSGRPEVLKIHEVPEPVISKGHVKIKVQHIGVNYAELLSRQGKYSWAPKRPYIPGMEGVGEVIEVGEGCKRITVGQQVIFGGQYGSYAEQIAVPEYMVFPVLHHMNAEENAAFLVNYITAWVVLFKLGRIQSEDKVLVQAAAGGVGTAAVQLAHKLGAEVYGLAGSEDKLKLVKELGANEAINYRSSNWDSTIKEKSGGVDIVLELVGGEVFRKSRALLNPFGKMAVAGYASIPFQKWNPYSWWLTWKNAPKVSLMAMAKKSQGIMATHIGYLTQDPEIVENNYQELADYMVKHDIKPIVGKVFSFDQMPQAHAWIESRKSVGKVIVSLS